MKEFKDLEGTEAKDHQIDLESIKRYSKVLALRVENGVIVDYRKTPGSETKPMVYTVESVSTEGLRLFQVGSYEQPLTFLKNGSTITQFKSKNWVNWSNYIICEMKGEEVDV
jgi:hypothetical protein